ncbi:MAG: hypothetical protein R2991_14660 [Thermoanaerobaculia bacterium]
MDARCEVCQEPVEESTAIEIVGTDDTLLLVCGQRCLEEFEVNPELYGAALDEDDERRTA